MRVFVEGVGLSAAGLDGWTASLPVLRGEQEFTPSPLKLPTSPLLPAAERRRMVDTVKLALRVGAEAFAVAKRDPAATATVFTSSGGDGDTIHQILETLTSQELEVSPTRFHNSVHNAPSGYWTIATGTREPTTCLCVHDASFSAGLLEAAAQATADERAVGLVAYDLPYPEPINAIRPVKAVFGVAFVLANVATPASFAVLDIALKHGIGAATQASNDGLDALRIGIPAARSIPLLEALARRAETSIILDHVAGNSLVVSIAPVA
jgi:hypothetical protein